MAARPPAARRSADRAAHRRGGRGRRRPAGARRSPRRPAGRCWPSRPAAPAPARTRSAATGCCSAAPLAERDRAGGRLRPPDAVASGLPAARPRATSRCWAADHRPRTRAGRIPVDRHVRPPRRGRATDPTWLASAGATPTPGVGRDLDALLAAEPDLTPYDVAGAVARALPPEGLLVVGASNPIRDLDLMVPRYPVGAPAQGDRQPRPVRHRRRRVDGGRRRARPQPPTAAWPCSAT